MTAPRLTGPLCAIFFASGASALILENLWFREASQLLGNSVWATSIVLSSFMGGLAVGSGLAGKYGHRVVRLVRLYGLLELTIAVAAALVILVLPQLTEVFSPLFRALAPLPALLGIARLVIAFALMLVPTAAMGATLPILVAALCRWEPHFGRTLGRLYGWNTLGAVAGILAVELVLVSALGIRGAAGVAVLLNVGAGSSALWLSRRVGEPPSAVAEPRRALAWSAWRVLASAFLCGAILLAFEVIWFRFLALYVLSTSIALSLMLAVILVGIGVGGLVASRWLLGRELLPWIALLAGILAVVTYAAFPSDQLPGSQRWQDAVADALRLALPVSLLSGALFTLLGDAAKRQLGGDARSVGLFVVANTLGAMVGALVGGFVLLPNVGMEGSCFILAASYGVVAVIAPRRASRRALALGALALATCLALFPFGSMMNRHIPQVLSPLAIPGAELVEYREGLTATLSLVEFRWADQPFAHQLITNGFSMSSSLVSAQRYMKLFVYWPVALRPELEDALLICYGVGQTAKALTDTASLERIDVVDISRDILALGRRLFPVAGTFPLDDPRVTVHVEDGRFFLQTTARRYDLITGEPPPPQVAGVVNLYTKEYFGLVRDHLTDGGMTTYWLPVHELSVTDARVITRAFCDVFPDCSLWVGYGYDWMLVGTRDFHGGATEAQISRQWHDPKVAPELAALGFEQVEQLGATFMADAAQLRTWLADAPALDDDHPDRLGHRMDPLSTERLETFAGWMDPAAARQRFADSALIARWWPADLRERTLPYFAAQSVLNVPALELFGTRVPMAQRIEYMRQIQTHTALRTPIVWLLGLTAKHLEILERSNDPTLTFPRAVRALADRHYAEAAALLATVTDHALWSASEIELLRGYALAMAAGAPQ